MYKCQDPKSYLLGYDFYTDADRTFRFVRDDVLGVARYNQAMDRMIADAGLKQQDLAARLWMTNEHLRELHREGHVIGLHSHTHPTRMCELSDSAQRKQFGANFEYLSQLLESAPQTMSHPCNSYNSSTLAILRDLGISLGFRANMVRGPFGILEMPREDHTNVLQALRIAGGESLVCE